MGRDPDIGKHPNAFNVTRRLASSQWLGPLSCALEKELGAGAMAKHLTPRSLTLLNKREMAKKLCALSQLDSFPADEVCADLWAKVDPTFNQPLPTSVGRLTLCKTEERGGFLHYYLRVPFTDPQLAAEISTVRTAIDAAAGEAIDWRGDLCIGVNVAEVNEVSIRKLSPAAVALLSKSLPSTVSLEPGRIAGQLAEA